MKSKLKHLLFTVICIVYVEMVYSIPVAPPQVYGAANADQAAPIDPMIIKTVIEGIIALVHIIISIRKDMRDKKAQEMQSPQI